MRGSAVVDEARARREAVLEGLIGAGPPGLSGEELAARLGCSRAAIHRHVEAIRRDGTPVEGGATGYRLGPGADPVVGRLVAAGLTGRLAGPVEWRATTGSTNDDALARAREGAAEGLVIGADLQTAGRGRRGRSWRSTAAASDSLMFSVLLRPPVAPVEAALLPIVTAVAVAEAIGPRAGIKWPNDILIDGRKAVGILCEMSANQERVLWAVAGVGINLRAAPELDDGRWRAGALGAEAPGRIELAAAVINHLSHHYARWIGGDRAGVLARYADFDTLRGRRVTMAVGEGTLEGVCEGPDELGLLRVRDDDGRRHTVAAGEVTGVREILE